MALALALALGSARPWGIPSLPGLSFPGPGRWGPRMTQAAPPSSTWFPQVCSPPGRLSNRGSAMSRRRSGRIVNAI